MCDEVKLEQTGIQVNCGIPQDRVFNQAGFHNLLNFF